MQWVYDFAEGSRDMRDLLGGKGANVAEMTRVLGADRVPAGFTITTEACVAYMKAGQEEPEGMADAGRGGARAAAGAGRQAARRRRGPAARLRPLAARASRCPGCSTRCSTSGLNDTSVEGLARATDNERFAWDSYRRFVQMFGNVSRDVPGEKFEEAIKEIKADRGVEDDTDLDVDALKELTQALPGALRLPAGPAGAAQAVDPRGVRLLDRRPRGLLPAHQPHPRRVGHGGQRPADGVRQHRLGVRSRRSRTTVAVRRSVAGSEG